MQRQGEVGPVAEPQQAAVFGVVQLAKQTGAGAVETERLQRGPRIAGNARSRKAAASQCRRGAVRTLGGFDLRIEERHQKSIRVANCIRLGWPARRIRPKNGPLSAYGSGKPRFGLFSELNASARTSTPHRSPIRKRLCRAASTTSFPGPGMMSRPALPNVYGAGALKALVLNQCSGVRWLAGRLMDCPGTMFGRVNVPALAVSTETYSGSSGVPSCSVTVPLSFQPPSSARCPRAPGRLYTKPALTRLPTLKEESPFSSCRLRSSCAPPLL